MEASQETGQVTGTKDKDYNLIWFTEQCLSNTLRLEDGKRLSTEIVHEAKRGCAS